MNSRLRWPHILVLMALCLGGLSGCPFDFGDPVRLPGACDDNDDCEVFETCSVLTGACTFLTPAYEAGRLVGPFLAPINDARVDEKDLDTRLGGASWRAQWVDSGEDGIEVQVPLNSHVTTTLSDGDPDEATWNVRAIGTRLQDWGFSYFVVYLSLPAVVLVPGDTRIMGINGFISICPNSSWWMSSKEACNGIGMTIAAVGTGTVSIDDLDVDSVPPLVRGYVDFEIKTAP